MSEKLSALIDNELDDLERARLLRELGRESDQAELWSRYHIIGLAMRRETVTWGGDLPGRVARALESEGIPGDGAEAPASPVFRLRPAGRLAIAASVAGVLLVGGLAVQLYPGDSSSGPAAPAAQQVAVDSEATRWNDVDPQVEDALNALLVEHGEFTSASGMNGLTAYTKFVAYDSRQ